MVEKFKYYNHSLIPNCLNCEEIKFTKNELKEAFKKHKKALFFLYTTKYDCGYDTGWYYVIRDNLDDHLSKMSKHHRQNLKRISKYIECRMIVASDYAARIKEIGFSAINSYKNYHDNQHFSYSDQRTIVGAFEISNNNLVGYEILNIDSKQISLAGEKIDEKYKQLGVSYALNEYVINNILPKYINCGGYISNGSKTIIHKTNHNQFLIDNLGFRKAYCYLHLIYRPSIKVAIVLLRALKPVLRLLDKNNFVHTVNSILTIDNIARKQRKMFDDYV